MTQEADDVVAEARSVSKAFTGVQALSDVSLKLRRGRLTALLGENGAGKSTLMNILAGVLQPDAGEVIVRGRAVRLENPLQAQERGVAMIFQELNLLPNLTIAENIFVGREPVNALGLIDYGRMNRAAAAMLEELEMPLPPTTIVGELRVGQQQVVEIAKALSYDPAVMIMDEPTSALTQHEVEVLFGLIQRLKARGVAIAYITHRLEELPRIGDDAVVMRDGRMVHAGPLAELSREEIIRLMVGRPAADFYAKTASNPGEELLRVRGLSLRDTRRRERFLVRNVDFSLRRGEVLGIFGLMGAGRTELLETLFGLHPHDASGEILLDGKRIEIHSPSEAIAHGLALVPEDRKLAGLVLPMSISENASLASLEDAEWGPLLSPRRERAHVQRFIERFRVKTPSLAQAVRNLSGGNQQKVVLAKWLATRPRIVLLDEPTRGIDVNAKREIYAMVEELAREGLAMVVVSSELPEVLAISDRIMVMAGGSKTVEFGRDQANERNVMAAALPMSMVG